MVSHGFRRVVRVRNLVGVGALFALVCGVWLVPAASAHSSLLTASVGCTGPVSYTATAWSGPSTASRTNTDVRISSSVDNGATWTQVGQGRFDSADGFSFDGTFSIGSSSDVRLKVQEAANWGDGAHPGPPDYTTASRPTNCTGGHTPPPTTTTTTTPATTTTPTTTTTTPVATTPASPPPATPPVPAIMVVKTERVGFAGGFVAGPLTVSVTDRVGYEIVVTNTGTAALTVALVDRSCQIRGGATLHVTGVVMAPGEKLTYHCSHVITAGDRPVYPNTATATGVAGSATVTAQSSVVANVTTAAVKAAKTVVAKHKVTTRSHVIRTAPPAKKITKPASFTG